VARGGRSLQRLSARGRSRRVGTLVLTHPLPGTDRRRAGQAARASFGGPIRVEHAGLTVALG
jgi:hypothetical protein